MEENTNSEQGTTKVTSTRQAVNLPNLEKSEWRKKAIEAEGQVVQYQQRIKQMEVYIGQVQEQLQQVKNSLQMAYLDMLFRITEADINSGFSQEYKDKAAGEIIKRLLEPEKIPTPEESCINGECKKKVGEFNGE